MSDESFTDAVEWVGKVVDWAGVGVIVGGIAAATVLALIAFRRGQAADIYRLYRQRVGKAILLGLEFLVAADIIRTVAVSPSFRGVGVLALIVLVRTFLSFTLELELEGRWPWQREKASTVRA
jgi:uncharacterized membrane protein